MTLDIKFKILCAIIIFLVLIIRLAIQLNSKEYELYAATLTLISGKTISTDNTLLSFLNVRRCKKTKQWTVLPDSQYWYMDDHQSFSSYAQWYILPPEQARLAETSVIEGNTIGLPLTLDLDTIEIAK